MLFPLLIKYRNKQTSSTWQDPQDPKLLTGMTKLFVQAHSGVLKPDLVGGILELPLTSVEDTLLAKQFDNINDASANKTDYTRTMVDIANHEFKPLDVDDQKDVYVVNH
jgi:hypothetical protein